MADVKRGRNRGLFCGYAVVTRRCPIVWLMRQSIRWALMGPHLTFHLGGGEGGMTHFMAHLGDQFQSQMDDLGTTRLTEPVRKLIINGVAAEAGSRSIGDLRRWRDRKGLAAYYAIGAPAIVRKAAIQKRL